ncbi:MAG: PAS domain-containing protein [Pseudomonadota bacterium]
MDIQSHYEVLRKAAELRLSVQPALDISSHFSEPDGLVHELQLHEVELQMQNEVLLDSLAREEALRAKYQDLFNFAPVGYVTLDRGGRVTDLNPKAVHMLSEHGREIFGQPFLRFVAPSSQPQVVAFLNDVLASTDEVRCEQIEMGEQRVVPHYLNLQARTRPDSASTGAQIHLVMLDVTALRMALDDVVKRVCPGG